jgi:L-2,4-diaminobutyrate transaminase
MSKVFYGTSGSDCNDSLIKIVWNYNYLRGKPQKQKIISRDYAYHGVSVATASLTGIGGFHRGFGLPLPFVVHTSCPHYYRYGEEGESEEEFCARMIRDLEELIEHEGADSIGAMIAEPIMGAGGVIVPPKGYFQEVQRVLKENDILLIADEVICGFGRLGTWFGHQFYDFVPDMVASAKGLTSGYFPMSAAFISEDIWQVLLKGSEELGAFYHGYTYTGHPVGAATALVNLDILERESLVENAAVVGAHLQASLRERLLKHPHVGEIRGEGLIAAVQLVQSKEPKKFYELPERPAVPVAAAAMKGGLIVRPLPTGDSLAISPPLTINTQEVDFLVDVLDKSLAEVY